MFGYALVSPINTLLLTQNNLMVTLSILFNLVTQFVLKPVHDDSFKELCNSKNLHIIMLQNYGLTLVTSAGLFLIFNLLRSSQKKS
mmetsp:Transcript_25635/g.22650  ORF Transcript_25635/g.22650 Transcript_25635/m.22650 type:complete len:86 (-) Transcript_25635:1595-1852(-)